MKLKLKLDPSWNCKKKKSQNLKLALVNVCIKLDSKLGTSHNFKKRTHSLSRAGLGILMISCYTIFLKSIFDWRFILISFVCYFHNCRRSSQGLPQERGVQGGGAPLKTALRLKKYFEKSIMYQETVNSLQISLYFFSAIRLKFRN